MKFETLERRIKEKYGNEFILISVHGDKMNRCTVQHNCKKCNNFIIKDIACKSDLYRGNYTCPECRRLNEKEKFINRLNEKGFIFVEPSEDPDAKDYKNCDNYVKIRHKCSRCNNYSWKIKPRLFNGNCKECSRLDRTKTTEDYVKDIYELTKGEYSLVEGERYTNNETPILHRHNCDQCGNYEWLIEPRHFLDTRNESESRIRCEKCREIENQLKIYNDFKEKVYNLVGDEYTITSGYVNNGTHVMMRHNCAKCNYHVWPVRPNLFTGVQSTRCPICASMAQDSKGELEMREFIESIVECYNKKQSIGILDGKDIDVLTKNNIGFEYNGEYWHSEGDKVPVGYHKNKILNAKDKNITLYHIWERNWLERKDEVKEFIRKAIEQGNLYE